MLVTAACVAGLRGSYGQSPDKASVYWTHPSTGTIKRAVASSGRLLNVETIVASRGLDLPESLALDVTDGRIYWTDWGMGRIMRANAALDGTGIEALVTGLRKPTGLALDVAGGRMYWIDSGRGRIQRSSLDGTGVETLVTSVGANDLALDLMSDLMYWTEPHSGRIRRATLAGVDVETLLSELDEPGNLALHVNGRLIYWIERRDENWKRPGVIRRASLDGTRVETILPELDNPVDLSLHLAEGRIYWLESQRDYCLPLGDCLTQVSHETKLQRADLDGANMETFGPTGAYRVPRGMALDTDGGKMYWTYAGQTPRGGPSTIRRVDLTGTNEVSFTPPQGLASPMDIALDAPREQIYWLDMDAIHRAALDGTSIRTLVRGLGDPGNLTLDLVESRLYWTDLDTQTGSYTIHRADLEGADVEPSLVPHIPSPPRSIALDVATSLMYWADEHSIRRASLKGGNVETLVDGLEKPHLSLDPVHRHLYWTDSADLTIRRGSPDGTNVETLIQGEWFVPPVDGEALDIEDLTLDLIEGKMYWVHKEIDHFIGTSWRYLYQADLDGSSVRRLHTPAFRSEDFAFAWSGSIERFGKPAIAVMQGGPTETLTTEVVRGLGWENPASSGLDASYPNPFNRRTRISYRLAAPGPVRLQIYNLLGHPLRTLVDEVQTPGSYRVEWDARDQRGAPVATGVYLTRLQYPGGVQSRQLLLLK